ncbi:MAG: TonB-dependent receptor plug domain-containing protein [Actinomycetota bacterium]|jgi:TonB-dependent SusC/RagA subfamily outer membrane receptor
MKNLTALVLLFLTAAPSGGQDLKLSGTVRCFNRYPLRNVEVIAGKSGTVITDSAGLFMITLKKGEKVTFEAEGFESFSLRPQKSDTVTVNLVFRGREKDLMVAIGNGYIRKEDLTFAVSNLQQENNGFSNFSSIYDLLRGRFPGVEVINTPAGPKIQVRGTNSLSLSGEPLFIVDGIPVDDISAVEPVNIRSVNVLKDAAASFYGTRGTNGVIIIETKFQ